MFKALALQASRACGTYGMSVLGVEAAVGLRGTTAIPTLTGWRAYSSNDDPAAASAGQPASEGDEASSNSSSGGTSRPSRSQTKEWRSWIDTKLDSQLGVLGQQQAAQNGAAAAEGGPSQAPADASAGQRAALISEALAAADDSSEGALPPAQQRKPGPPPRAQPRAKGLELEQQIYEIIAPAPLAAAEDSGMPEGVTTYGQLAMASDAPRFERAAANIEEISPHRVHPSRLFFPHSVYSPAELNPYRTREMVQEFEQAAPLPITAMEVSRYADYKNVPLLATFVSESGKLPLRKRTQLRAKLHRHLCRQIKIARQMALLSPTERWRPEKQADFEAPPQRPRARQQST